MYDIINERPPCQKLSILFASLIYATFYSAVSLEIADVGIDGGQIHHRQALLAARSSASDAQEAAVWRASVGAALGNDRRRGNAGPASHRQPDRQSVRPSGYAMIGGASVRTWSRMASYGHRGAR